MGKLEKQLDTCHAERVIELRLPTDRVRAMMVLPFWIGRVADAFERNATDLIGGVHAWFADALPVVPGPTPVEQIAGRTASVNLGNLGGPHVEDKPAH